jgi:hypothetical protein
MIKTILATLVVAAGVMVPVVSSTPADAKDPCFFTDSEFSTWKNENSGNPGWGDSLTHVQNIAGGCSGQWTGGLLLPKDCPQDDGNFRYFRSWPQKDGDQVWIGFADYDPASPRYRAHCDAGIYHPATNTYNRQVSQN